MFFNAMNFNQLKGRVIGEPEYKETKSGKKLLTFNLMYFTRQSTDSEGSHTNFINVEAWQKIAELCSPYISKGVELIVNGTFVQKRWNDENGKIRSNFIFSADAINITESTLSESNISSPEEALEKAA